MPPTRRSTSGNASSSSSRPGPSTSTANRRASQLGAAGSSSAKTSASSTNASLKAMLNAWPATATPGYESTASSSSAKGKERSGGREPMTQDEKTRLVQEIVGFLPRKVLDAITEAALDEVYRKVRDVETFITQIVNRSELGERSGKGSKSKSGKGKGMMDDEAEMREIDTGMHALETLLVSHADAAFDKFQAWALRNTFDVQDGLEIVIPWHEGLDFDRGEYVASQLEGGEDGIRQRNAALREEVVQLRKVKQKLIQADSVIDKKLKTLEKQRLEVGFVLAMTEEAGLAPLDHTSSQIVQTISSLHESLTGFDIVPAVPGSSTLPEMDPHSRSKEWEYGRAAYLNWATKKLLRGEGGREAEVEDTEQGGRGRASDDRAIERMAQEAKDMADPEGLAALARHAGR